MRKVPALQGGVIIHGAIMPSGWATRLEGEAMDRRLTRAEVVRQIINGWLKKHPEYASVRVAADAHNRSYSQQIRQIMEDEVPKLCPPIQEWRGDGMRHSDAIRKSRVGKKMVPTVTIQIPAKAMALFKQIALKNPEIYPNPEDVMAHLVTRWADKQLEKAGVGIYGASS